ncbi:hypothetical protein [Haloterrigena alkaliphila]|uniref:hypothetical protein n=1 Tax=Haloterrigena alkaliphila TaxID=2816475 RepID=UPI0031F2F875
MVAFAVETTVERSLSGVVSRLEAGEPVTPRELFTVVMQGDHDPTVHDRIALASADRDDLTDGFLERLTAYLGGDLRRVTDSRTVIDVEAGERTAGWRESDGSANGSSEQRSLEDTDANPYET